jgi:hypothetical protein
MKTLSPIVPDPNPCAQLSVVRCPESFEPSGHPSVPPDPPLPMDHPQQDAAPVALPTSPQGDGEQRSPVISRASGVSQFLDIQDDVIAVADCLKAIMEWHGDKVKGGHPRFRHWIRSQEEELRDIAWDIADICNDLIPGAPTARSYQFAAYLENFDPPSLPGGSDQNNKVSQRLTPVPPEWMSSRQKQINRP